MLYTTKRAFIAIFGARRKKEEMGPLLSVDGVILTDDRERRTSQLSFGLFSTKRMVFKIKMV